MITPDGWFDWAVRKPGPSSKVNVGTNAVKGIFCHSAEGYETGMWSVLANQPVSWHLSNLFSGQLFQHYPLTARCWHATAANPSYVGMEHEGRVPTDPTLSEAQIATTVRVIRELAEWKGWTPTRPSSSTDTSHTLWEHREVTRLGGSATACPSGRIPWDAILSQLSPQPPEPDFIPHDLEALGAFLSAMARNQRIVWADKDIGLVEVLTDKGLHMEPRHYFFT